MWANLFNLVNARELRDEVFGPFMGLFKNYIFLAVLFGCAGLQAIFVQFGGVFFKVTGLSGEHWGVSVGMGALTIFMGFVVRLLPSFDRPVDFSAFYSTWFYEKMLSSTGTITRVTKVSS